MESNVRLMLRWASGREPKSPPQKKKGHNVEDSVVLCVEARFEQTCSGISTGSLENTSTLTRSYTLLHLLTLSHTLLHSLGLFVSYSLTPLLPCCLTLLLSLSFSLSFSLSLFLSLSSLSLSLSLFLSFSLSACAFHSCTVHTCLPSLDHRPRRRIHGGSSVSQNRVPLVVVAER